MRVLITGGNGQLSCALLSHPACKNLILYAPSHHDMDITRLDSIDEWLKQFPVDCIINTAAYTAVDKAEQESSLAMEVNYLGAKNIATLCADKKLKLIHLSTDYVFSGDQLTPYREEDKANPINQYGQSKWLGECAIHEIAPSSLILRVSGIFSEFKNNFLKTMLRLAKEKTELKIVADQITCPTDAADIAAVIYQLIKFPALTGTWHFCSEPATSWFEFAQHIIAAARVINPTIIKTNEIIPITAREFNAPATRPAYSVLNCEKIKSQLQLSLPHWQHGIDRVLKVLI